jgi:NH3-dependent NAD+ synthetase
MTDIDARLARIVAWIGEHTDVAAGRGALVPVSGGSDSALCLWLCARALPPGHVTAAFAGHELRCRDWFEALAPVRFVAAPDATPRHVEAARWATMLSLSLDVRGWLVGTRNRTEDELGTFSLASRVATLLPLAGLWKSEVMAACAHVGVPAAILASSRRADPACGRPQAMADIPFEQVDAFLAVRSGEAPESRLSALAPDVVAYLEAVWRRNRFKRALPLFAPG